MPRTWWVAPDLARIAALAEELAVGLVIGVDAGAINTTHATSIKSIQVCLIHRVDSFN